jgi:hypothetical protein
MSLVAVSDQELMDVDGGRDTKEVTVKVGPGGFEFTWKRDPDAAERVRLRRRRDAEARRRAREIRTRGRTSITF